MKYYQCFFKVLSVYSSLLSQIVTSEMRKYLRNKNSYKIYLIWKYKNIILLKNVSVQI